MDRIIVSAIVAIRRKYGRFVISPLGILIIFNSKSFNSLTLSWSKGVERNIIFFYNLPRIFSYNSFFCFFISSIIASIS